MPTPIAPPSAAARSRRRPLAFVQREQKIAVALTDRVPLDLHCRRELTVRDREGLAGDDEAPHPLQRGQVAVDSRHGGADGLLEGGVLGERREVLSTFVLPREAGHELRVWYDDCNQI